MKIALGLALVVLGATQAGCSPYRVKREFSVHTPKGYDFILSTKDIPVTGPAFCQGHNEGHAKSGTLACWVEFNGILHIKIYEPGSLDALDYDEVKIPLDAPL